MQGATVYVDINLTPELEAEGNARELIRRIQEMRRQIDLNVEDFIHVYVMIGDSKVCDLVASRWEQGIRDEVRAYILIPDGSGRNAAGRPVGTDKRLGYRGTSGYNRDFTGCRSREEEFPSFRRIKERETPFGGYRVPERLDKLAFHRVKTLDLF